MDQAARKQPLFRAAEITKGTASNAFETIRDRPNIFNIPKVDLPVNGFTCRKTKIYI